MDRRRVLALMGSAAAVTTGGCLSSGPAENGPAATDSDDPERDPATDGPTPTEGTTGDQTTDQRGTETGTPAVTPPDNVAPPPGDCEAESPPNPDSSDGLPDPKPYPERPGELTRSSVRSFLDSYERAHRHNRELAALVADGECVRYLDVSGFGTEVWRVEDGFTGLVETRSSYTGAPCGTPGSDTPTPEPHADLPIEPGRYYVTDRFLVRNGVVIACWG